METLDYGIIGTGGMGYGHLKCLKNIEGARVVAGADPHEPNLARCEKENGEGKYFTDYRELLEMDEVRAVVVATPDSTHVDIVLDALRAGKHVLSEKPAATTREDLSRLEAEVVRAKTVYQVGLECRFFPVYARMHGLIEEGAVGSPRMLWCKEFRGPFLEKVNNWIMFNEFTGGAFNEKTCHFFDLMNWFAGARPKKVAAFAGTDVVKDIYGVKPDVVDNGWAMVEYDNNARAMLGLCMFAVKGETVEMGVLGDRGQMVGSHHDSRICCRDYDSSIERVYHENVDPEVARFSHNGAVYLEHLEFAECVRGGRTPLTGIDAARFSTLVGLAAQESADKGGSTVMID